MRSVASVSTASIAPGFGRVRRLVAAVFTGAIVALALAVPALAVPVGFEDVVVATGLDRPTAMAVAPDGRVFVAQQGGQLRVVKNDVLLPPPFVTVPVRIQQRARTAGRGVRPELRREPVRLRLLHG
jgi:glucose/arabinose dehydrogenase